MTRVKAAWTALLLTLKITFYMVIIVAGMWVSSILMGLELYWLAAIWTSACAFVGVFYVMYKVARGEP